MNAKFCSRYWEFSVNKLDNTVCSYETCSIAETGFKQVPVSMPSGYKWYERKKSYPPRWGVRVKRGESFLRLMVMKGSHQRSGIWICTWMPGECETPWYVGTEHFQQKEQ